MAQNDFKAFGTGNGANVLSQTEWEALEALATGFQSGKASSAQVNKALRQGTSMAAVLAQYIATNSGADVRDDGDTALALSNLTAALQAGARASNAQYAVDSGAANSIVINPLPAFTALVDGQTFDIACAAANSGAVTLQVNALNAYPLLGSAGALQGGEIGAAKGVIRVIWSASKSAFLLTGQNTSGALAVAAATKANHAMQLGQASGRLLNGGPRMITTSGNYTPAVGTTFIIVEMVGGSGGTGGAIACGDGQSVCTSPSCQGAYAMAKYSNPGTVFVTIGAAGGAGGTNGQAGIGGNSSFGALLTCPGGQGSYSAVPSATAIAPSTGATAGTPTGSGIISTLFGKLPASAFQISNGIALNFLPGTIGPMAGTNFGASQSGIYRGQNAPATSGNVGWPGACRIWEYA